MTVSKERVPIADIVDGLTNRIEDLCAALLPLGRRAGNEYADASTAHGGLGDSLKVCVRGRRRGVWSHFGGTGKGDALDLVAYVRFGGDKKSAIDWSLAWLGYDVGHGAPAAVKIDRAAIEAKRRAREAEARAEEDAKRRNAMAIWMEAEERLRDTPVDAYLRGRGLDLRALGRQPRAIRFHPRLWQPQLRVHVPAMVACITRGGALAGVHRTWLGETDGGWGKITATWWNGARGERRPVDAKMTLAPYVGGAVRVWRGEGARSFKDATGEVAITEGIEDALAVAIALPERRVLAAVSLSNMRDVLLPDGIDTVTLFADNDPELDRNGKPHPARRALIAAAEAHAKAGRTVRIARPPDGTKDVNDLLRGCASADGGAS